MKSRHNPERRHGLPLVLCYADTDGPGTITGYGAVFNKPDATGDTVMPGAFGASLARHKEAGTMPALLWQHDAAQPIGTWLEAREDQRGLYLRGKLNLETARGREAYALAKDGGLDGLSIGYNVRKSATGKSGARLLTELDLWEISLVTFPAQPAARITGVKSAQTTGEASGLQLRDRAHLEDLLRQAGLSRGAARNIAAGGWPMLAKADDVDDDAAKLLLHSIQTLNSQIGNS